MAACQPSTFPDQPSFTLNPPGGATTGTSSATQGEALGDPVSGPGALPAPANVGATLAPGAPLPASFLLEPNGQAIALSAGATVAVPAGMSGLWSLFLPGYVPSTIDAPGGALTLHPAPVDGSPPPQQSATVAGALSRAQAGIIVQYISAGRRLFTGSTTDAGGNYRFQVPVTGTETGVVVAQDGAAVPALDAARVTLTAGSTTAVRPLTPMAPLADTPDYRVLRTAASPDSSSHPALPTGLYTTEGALELSEGSGAAAWRATLVVRLLPPVPTYNLPGLVQVHTYTAVSADNSRTSITSGPPGAVPDYLVPPDLSGLPTTLSPGTALHWPAVAGSSLYTLRLTAANQATSSLWEGATQNTTLTVPGYLSLPEQDLTLEIDAWDAPPLTLYAVAALQGKRNLQVPATLPGPTGRRSFSRVVLHFHP